MNPSSSGHRASEKGERSDACSDLMEDGCCRGLDELAGPASTVAADAAVRVGGCQGKSLAPKKSKGVRLNLNKKMRETVSNHPSKNVQSQSLLRYFRTNIYS